MIIVFNILDYNITVDTFVHILNHNVTVDTFALMLYAIQRNCRYIGSYIVCATT